jgi:hypothetical protein
MTGLAYVGAASADAAAMSQRRRIRGMLAHHAAAALRWRSRVGSLPVTSLAIRHGAPGAARTRKALARLAGPAVIVLLVAFVVHSRAKDLGAPLWIDEGISFGIAHHPLQAIPGVLRQDGSPPLFYLLLHGWTALFGDGIRSGHTLSLVFAALAIPVAAWAVGGVAGAWAGMAAAAVVALDPFTSTYAIEVRMYSLVLLLGLAATGLFLRAYVRDPASRWWPAGFAVALAAVLYTHNWGAFFAAAAGASWLALLVAAPSQGRRALLVGGAIGFGGALLLFAPWLPSLAEQAAHTAAPWSHVPNGRSIGRSFERVLGGKLPETLLLVVAGGGAIHAVWQGPVARRAVLAAIALTVGTYGLAFAWSNLSSPAWAVRYLSIVLAPLAVAIGIGLSRTGAVGFLALVVAFAVGWQGKPTHSSFRHKSNTGLVARQMAGHVRPGTLVFSTQPEQVPLLRYELPAGLRYATPLGRVADPWVMDWREAMARLRRARVTTGLGAEMGRLRRGELLLLVQPRFGHPDAPWTRRIRELARRQHRFAQGARGIRVIRRVLPHRGYSRSTVSGVLLEKIGEVRRRPAAGHRAHR